MRIRLVAAVITSSFILTAAAMATPPVRERFPADGEFQLDRISDACGFPVTVAIEGTFSVTVFLDRDGATIREIDTQPGTLITYSTAAGEISVPFSGVLHTTYPEGAVLGAPAELVLTGNSGPFGNLVPTGSGRAVFAGYVAETDGPFARTRFTELTRSSGNFTTQIDRICDALAP
jgi:hypothetical protein